MAVDPEIDLTLDNLMSQGDDEAPNQLRFRWDSAPDPREIFFPSGIGHLIKKVRQDPETGMSSVYLVEDDGSMGFLELIGKENEVFEEDPYDTSLERILGLPREDEFDYISEGGRRCERCGRVVQPWENGGEYPVCDKCDREMEEQSAQENLQHELFDIAIERTVLPDALGVSL